MLYCIKYMGGQTDRHRSDITTSRAPVGAIKKVCVEDSWSGIAQVKVFRFMSLSSHYSAHAHMVGL